LSVPEGIYRWVIFIKVSRK